MENEIKYNFDFKATTDQHQHGGSRAGAGRPRSLVPRRSHNIFCTDAEYNIISLFYHFVRYDYLEREQLETLNRYIKQEKRRMTV